MRTIEHDDSRAGRLVIALMNVQILVFEIERHFQSLALNRGKQCSVDVEIDGVAELVTFACRGRFNTGREINSVVASCGALAKTSKQVSECFVPQKIEAFFSHFKANVSRQWIGNFARPRSPTLLFARLWLLFV